LVNWLIIPNESESSNILLKTHEAASLLRVHGRSGTEWGLDGKDLASAYVLRPLDWQVLIFQC
jgi:hypothetical protein